MSRTLKSDAKEPSLRSIKSNRPVGSSPASGGGATCSDRGTGGFRRDEGAEETEADAPPSAVLRVWSRSVGSRVDPPFH